MYLQIIKKHSKQTANDNCASADKTQQHCKIANIFEIIKDSKHSNKPNLFQGAVYIKQLANRQNVRQKNNFSPRLATIYYQG